MAQINVVFIQGHGTKSRTVLNQGFASQVLSMNSISQTRHAQWYPNLIKILEVMQDPQMSFDGVKTV